MSRAALLGMAGIAAASTWALDARAICGRAPDAAMTPLPTGMRAPRNAQVMLTLPSAWRTRAFCGASSSERCASGAFDLVLREAPGLRAPATPPPPIPFTLREAALGATAVVILQPAPALAQRTRYEVVRVERSGAVAPLVVGTFATGDTSDITPPAWSGVARHRWSSLEPSTRRGVVSVVEECAANELTLIADTPATDDATPPSALRYGVWLADEGAPIDYTSAPRALLAGVRSPKRGGGDELTLAIPMEIDGKLALPGGNRRAKVGVRALDAAGNPSAASELTVSLP